LLKSVIWLKLLTPLLRPSDIVDQSKGGLALILFYAK